MADGAHWPAKSTPRPSVRPFSRRRPRRPRRAGHLSRTRLRHFNPVKHRAQRYIKNTTRLAVTSIPACPAQAKKGFPVPSSRPYQPAARGGGGESGSWIHDDVGRRSRRRLRGRRRRGLRRRAPRLRLRPVGARRRRRCRQMRRVPPPPAGFLVVERGDRRPGRQVRAAVRWAALHRDARHGAPLKSPSFLRGFFLSVRFAGRGELLPY